MVSVKSSVVERQFVIAAYIDLTGIWLKCDTCSHGFNYDGIFNLVFVQPLNESLTS